MTTQPASQPEAQQPQAQPSEETETVEKGSHASELLAYRVVDDLAETIANRVSQKLKTGSSILLVSDLEQALGGMPLAEVRGQISLIQGAFDDREKDNRRLLKEPPAVDEAEAAGAAGIVGEVLGTLPELLTLFLSDYTITERDFDVKDSALLSSIAGSLVARESKKFKVFIHGFYSSGDSEILDDLAKLSLQVARLKTQRESLALLLPKPGEKEDPKKQEEEKQKRLAEIAAAVQATDGLLLSFEGFRTSLTTPPQGQTQTKLEKALIRERTETLEITHLLWLGNLSSGGETIVRKGLFVYDSIGFMGGAAICFVLADNDGLILDGNTYAQQGITGGKLKDYIEGNMPVHYSLALLPHQSTDETKSLEHGHEGSSDETNVSVEENKDLVRREQEELWNHSGDLDAAEELFAADQAEAAKQQAADFRRGFPDVISTIEDLIAEEDKVVARWRSRATHQGDYMGIPPSGKEVEFTGISIYRIEEGKIAQSWNSEDQFGLMRQIGAITEPGQSEEASST
jgi:predicted ester cyclase